MQMYRVGISDCDHEALKEEKAVFGKNGIALVLHQCRTEDDLIRELQEYEVIGNQYAPLTEKVFCGLPRLRCAVRYGVGVDNVDLEAATRHGVKICNVPDYGVQEVAAHAAAFMLALCRKIIPMDRDVKRGRWNYKASIPINRFNRMTIGIIGLGRIGKCFARIVQGLDCRIIAYDPRYGRCSGAEIGEHIALVPFPELLETADIVSIHTPLESSRGMIGEKELRLMKTTAYLINVSRGGIIDEEALDRALENRWIAGAACDVFEKEPPGGTPLLRHENFIATPHMAWYSEQASRELKTKLAEEMTRACYGLPLKYQLNRSV